MNLTLWIAAGLLALVALGGGISKTFVRKEKLEKRVASGWVKDVSPGFVRALGVLELLAAVGLILPAVVDIAPVLVPVTAVCMVLLMAGAVITHVRYHDGTKVVVVVSIYLVLAAFIGWGRFGPEAFTG
ncbi:DoxX family protein [Micromonospora sp. DT201]|uniref:DoxX family protein n=1 Tax=Micromonospora sp. DT201 TaxID=3393442 RepID=UPI003CE6AE8B